ncbi:MAG: 16S rRNA (guanine(966)-N(2))-methyltransferase RsmD [Alphaproteobacteria bacterium]|jgi:16S rRNA (guanine966-N2)-methyltransferase
MRISSGLLKGRKISSKLPNNKELEGFRPTSGKVKQAIFNIIIHNQNFPDRFLQSANVLDLCCGTGSLGIEAISRGALGATFIDNNIEILKLAEKNVAHLGADYAKKAKFLRMDAFEIPPKKPTQAGFDLIFLDPPYKEPKTYILPNLMVDTGWLNKNGFIVLETNKSFEIKELSPKLKLLIEKKYNNTKVFIFGYNLL